MKIKTIDIHAKEWHDKENGNSYFAAVAVLNFGMKDERKVKIPFQYGYENSYVEFTMHELEKQNILSDVEHHENGSTEPFWRYCEDRGIILRNDIKRKCKRREVEDLIR